MEISTVKEWKALETFGRHLLAEYYGCNPDVLNDKKAIENLLKEGAESAGATIVKSVLHTFSPQGVSGVIVIEESHISIHTWPEIGYAAVDFYTCGDCIPKNAHDVLVAGLTPSKYQLMTVHRGIEEGASMKVHSDETVEIKGE